LLHLFLLHVLLIFLKKEKKLKIIFSQRKKKKKSKVFKKHGKGLGREKKRR